MLHSDLRSGYQGPGFGMPPDIHMVVQKFKLSQADAEVTALKAAIADMQETLDDYGIHNSAGMSENAHKRMYEKLHALTKAVELHKEERGGEAAHNRHVLMTALSDVIMRNPSVLRTDPTLHIFIHPEVLHTAANHYAALQLNRRNALLMRGYPPDHPTPPLIVSANIWDVNLLAAQSRLLGEDDLKTTATIAKAIDRAKFEWLDLALGAILPTSGATDLDMTKPFEKMQPFQQEWHQALLGVTRRVICAYAHLSIDTAAQLERHLARKSLKTVLIQLFFRDFTVLDTNLHNSGTPSVCAATSPASAPVPTFCALSRGSRGVRRWSSACSDWMLTQLDTMPQADIDSLRRRVRMVLEVATRRWRRPHGSWTRSTFAPRRRSPFPNGTIPCQWTTAP